MDGSSALERHDKAQFEAKYNGALSLSDFLTPEKAPAAPTDPHSPCLGSDHAWV